MIRKTPVVEHAEELTLLTNTLHGFCEVYLNAMKICIINDYRNVVIYQLSKFLM